MTISATTDGKRILVKIPPKWEDPTPHKLITELHGTYRGASKTWGLPLTPETCHELRRTFGRALTIKKPLSSWYREEVSRRGYLEGFRAGDADTAAESLARVATLSPTLFMAMSARPYQLTGAAFLGEARAAILGDEPGLGKTVQSLAALTQEGCAAILVVCPRTAMRTVWVNETNLWAPHIAPFVAQGTKDERLQVMRAFHEFPSGPKMLIVNKEMVRTSRNEHKKYVHDYPYLFSRYWDAIIMDESHNIIAGTTNLNSKKITLGRMGALKLRSQVRPSGLALSLSGTPERSNLKNLWGQLNWCAPKVFTSYWRFADGHFGVEEGDYGKVVGGGENFPEPKDQAKWEEEIRPYFLQRTKEEVAPDLPPVTYAGTPRLGDPDGPKAVWLDMDAKQRRAYEQMVKLAYARLRNGTLLATGVLAEITRLRQLACTYGRLEGEDFEPYIPSDKVDWLVEFLTQYAGRRSKVLVASSFTKLINMTAIVLRKEGFSVATLTGETSDKGRSLFQTRFNDPWDSLQVGLINTFAGGESITLDGACDNIVLMDLPWREFQEKQVVNRIHRISRIHKVTCYRLLSVGTVDSWMLTLTNEQRRIINAARPEALDIFRGALDVA